MKGRTLLERVDDVSALEPGRVAVQFQDTEISYGRLTAASHRVAARLKAVGVRPGDLVAVRLDPSVELVAALLGILRCGAGYVPLDAQNPPGRTQLILADCRPRALIGDPQDGPEDCPEDGPKQGLEQGSQGPRVVPTEAVSRALAGLPDAGDAPAGSASEESASDESASDDRATPADPDAVCYVIYTSGTSGQPKGVPVSHRNVLALFEATGLLFTFRADDAWLMYHSVAFDFSVWELWGALLHGARLVVLDRWTKLSPDACAEEILARGVTVLSQTPTAFGMLSRALLRQVHERGARPRLRYVVFGGERLSMSTLLPWVERFGVDHPELVNMYGLTEATVHTTYHRITTADLSGEESVIGRPLPGFQFRVVPEDRRGELMVAGPQVTAGYLNRPQLTAERFGSDPIGELPETAFYRTGDLVELRAGRLSYLGRADRQVKLRGHRVELGEVEAALAAVPDVAEAVVLLLDGGSGGPGGSGAPVLACGYTTHSGHPVPPRTFRVELRARVPQYMLPARFHWVEQMPLTVNGKTDPHALRKEMELTP